MGARPVCVWPLGAMLGEGPVWSVAEQALWFVDIRSDRVHRFDPASGTGRDYAAPARPGFIVAAADRGFVVGCRDGLHRFDAATGRFEHWLAVETGLPGNRLNDGAVDPAGRLWFGTMDESEATASGGLYRHHSGVLARLDDGFVVLNGPAFSPDGRWLYFADTLGGVVYVCALDAEGGLGERRALITIDPAAGHPDGLTVDSQGCLWVGLFGGGAARRYAPDGTMLAQVDFPCRNVTKIAFGGADLRDGYATTARIGDQGSPLAGGLFGFRVEVAGIAAVAVRAGAEWSDHDRPGH